MTDITIKDYGDPKPPEGQKRYSTDELQKEFEVLGFMAPYVVVRRKSDGQKGCMEFTHRPRWYFDFQPSD